MRLIDADALMQTLGITDTDCHKCAWADKPRTIRKRGSDFEDACIAIENAPTIEERKTGNWKWGFADNGWADWTCSECGWTENNDIHVSLGYKYCPHCGSYMKGVISDEEKNKRYMESLEKEESDDN